MRADRAIDASLWTSVAEALGQHLDSGRGHLLTEDVMRFATVLELERLGVTPECMRPEFQAPDVGGKIDLVIDSPPTVAIEFKFPRDSRTGISPDTMTLGELLKDFYRLAYLPIGERWIVQMVNDRLRRFLDRRPELTWVWDEGGGLVLPAELLTRLPLTARRVFTRVEAIAGVEVLARCAGSRRFGGWTLASYELG